MLLVQDSTLGPVPIRLNTFVSALRSQLVFERLDKQPVPREEEARIVDLPKVRCTWQWKWLI